MTGKSTPTGGAVIDFMKGKDYYGRKPTVASELYQRATPISVQNIINAKDNHSANKVLDIIGNTADVFGFSYNSPQARQVNWSDSSGVELQSFQKKVGNAKFQAANDTFNKRVDQLMKGLDTNKEYQSLGNDERKKALTKKKEEIKQSIFKQYGFKYKKAKPKKIPKI
jgi:hypothetical protein